MPTVSGAVTFIQSGKIYDVLEFLIQSCILSVYVVVLP